MARIRQKRRQVCDAELLGPGAAGGIGIGTVIAIVASWSVNHSILWAFLHALIGWIYVIYWFFTYA